LPSVRATALASLERRLGPAQLVLEHVNLVFEHPAFPLQGRDGLGGVAAGDGPKRRTDGNPFPNVHGVLALAWEARVRGAVDDKSSILVRRQLAAFRQTTALAAWFAPIAASRRLI